MYIIRYIPNFSAVPSNRNICYFARAMKPARRVKRNDLAPKTRIIRFERASDLNAAKNRMSDDYNSPFETGNSVFCRHERKERKKALQFHVIAWNVESNIERSWNRSLTGERKEELFRNRVIRTLATVFNFLMFNRTIGKSSLRHIDVEAWKKKKLETFASKRTNSQHRSPLETSEELASTSTDAWKCRSEREREKERTQLIDRSTPDVEREEKRKRSETRFQ